MHLLQKSTQSPKSASATLSDSLRKHGLQEQDGNYVHWTSNSPDHPRNWTFWRKCYDTSYICVLELVVTAIGTAGTSSADASFEEYGITRVQAYAAFSASYLIASAIGGVVFPPYSESFGRRGLYIVTGLLFTVSCVVTGAVHSLVATCICRIIQGCLSSVPAMVGVGSVEDMWDNRQRVWSVWAWTTCSNVGLVLGPIYGAYITAYLNWRWSFYIATIIMATLTMGSFFVQESRPTRLLQRKLEIIRKETGHDELQIHNPDHLPTAQEFINVALLRPLKLFFTEPIVFFCSIMIGIAFGLIYGLTESLTIVYEEFGFSAQATTLPFIAILVGLLLTAFSRLYDLKVLGQLAQDNATIDPEAKIRPYVTAVASLVIGLWWFAWTIPPRAYTHWIVPTISLVLIGVAANDFDTVLCGYLSDAYTIYASSAFAAVAACRALVAAGFALWTYPMYTNLDPNVATSILAVISTIFAVTPWIFLKYGRQLREHSEFARYSTKMENKTSLEAGAVGMTELDSYSA